MKTLPRVCLALILAIGMNVAQIRFDGRIGVSSDGNQHDPDDIGSSAWSVAMIACAGAQYVHHDYSNHLPDNDPDMNARMTESVTHAAEVFVGSTEMTFNCQSDLDGAVANIAAQVNASSADDRFYYALGGPMEVPWRGINAADPEKRQYVTVISHSPWNDDHTGGEMTHKWDDVCALGVECINISNQNINLQENDLNTYWSWSKNHEDENIRWLDSRRMGGDISDAGMVYYIVTGLGVQDGSPLDVGDLLNQGYDTGSTGIETGNVTLRETGLRMGIGGVHALSALPADREVTLFGLDGNVVFRGNAGSAGSAIPSHELFIIDVE